jgi:predicted Zn-dependent peptidase
MLDNTHKEIIKLKNGMRCLILPTQSPLTEISINIAYGSANEKPNEVELAHYTEHLFARFLSKKYPDQTLLENEMRKRGAETNASVSLYETRYYIKGLYEDVEFYMDILSNTMKNLVIEEKITKQEKNAVSQELRIQMSDNEWKFDQKIWNYMYSKYAYQSDTPEHIRSLKNYDVNRIKKFVRNNYLLQNTTIILNCPYGGVKKTKVLLNKYFNLPNKCPKCFVSTPEFSYKHKKLQIIHIKNTSKSSNNVIVRHYVNKNIKFMSNEHIAILYIKDILFNFQKGLFYKELRDKHGLIYSMLLNLDIDMKNSKSSVYFLETSTKKHQVDLLIFHLINIISDIKITKSNIENSRQRFKIQHEMQKFNNLTTFNKLYRRFFTNNLPIVERSDINKKIVDMDNQTIQKYVNIFKNDLMKGIVFYYSNKNLNKDIQRKIGSVYEVHSI